MLAASGDPHTGRTLMTQRGIRYLLASAIAIVGPTLVTASPGLAAGRCSPSSHPTVAVCVNHGDDGNSTRGDFYIYRTPDSSIYTYKEILLLNGRETRGPKTGRINHTGRFCCLYKNFQTLPITTKSVANRVYIYTRSGNLHMMVDSPTIIIRN
jgi:hypothetical protein